MKEAEWQQEQSRVDEVIQKVALQMDELEKRTGNVRSDVVEIRKHFWDEVTINFSHAEDLTETYFSMKQQADVMSERERSHRHASATLGKYRRLVQSPYFGRIDFVEENTEKKESIYLGIASFMDEENDTFLIYDWRAPVSSLYYDYGPGAAQYDTPGGIIKGEMLLKRQFVIRDGQIKLLFDTGITIGDELLQQALSRSADSQMRSIVATIQKEQNQIIRNERSRMLIVQGAAGSGKTSAALQRVAYLLYKNRETLRADQMVLFSPNPLFNSYVSTVLPELGEENMEQTTFQEYLENRLGKEFELEDPFEQMEYILSTDPHTEGYAARMESIRYKSSAAYLETLRKYTERLETEGMLFKPLAFRGKEIVSAEAMKVRFYAMDAQVKLANRVVLLRDWLLTELSAFAKKEWNEAWVEEEMELLSQEDYQRAYQKVRKQGRNKEMSFDDFNMEKELLARVIVRERLKPVRSRIKSLRFVDVTKLYRQLFDNPHLLTELVGGSDLVPAYWSEISRQTTERMDKKELSYEDSTPYLYLKEQVQGFQMNTNVRHVFVDEAQDYSPFQLEFLKRLFPRGRMTALGDLNQAIFAHTSVFGEEEPLVQLFGSEQTELIRLTRSYRSTREIVEFTRGMVPGGESIIPFNRGGEKPQVISVMNEDELHEQVAMHIEELQADGYESIAVICKTAAESRAAYEALASRTPVNLVKKETAAFSKGTQIIPAYLAKGVEFDAVILYNGSQHQYGRENERKLFYTACTRAMHSLRVFSIGEPSFFVTTQPQETYVPIALVPEADPAAPR
ncbi:RNA polymerase recycling motor HelD [Paenibacillus abyssi]|nr:RNA polymerase recycling motor HelD [Paenibacillus abyssi]